MTLINFQYRFLHRILPKNSFPTKIGIKQGSNCYFCPTIEENLAHFFWHCPNVQTFWRTLTEKLADFDFIPRDYSKNITVFLGLKSETSKFCLQINFCFLLARRYVWGCRTCNRTPQLKMFLKTLQSQYKTQSCKQVSTNNPKNKKWDPLVPLFKGNC